MSTFKLPKRGEGTRERKKSVYGEGGRAIGGMARRSKASHPVTAKVSAPNKKKPPKLLAPIEDDLPLPGGHPNKLPGKDRKPNPFQALADSGGMANLPELSSGDSLIDLIKKPEYVQRPTRDKSIRAARLQAQKERAPILKEGITLDEIQLRHVGEGGAGLPDKGSLGEDRESLKEGNEGSDDNNEAANKSKGDITGEDREGEEVLDGTTESQDNAFSRALAQTEHKSLTIIDSQPRSLVAEKAQRKAIITRYTENQEEAIAGILSVPGVICNRCPASDTCPEFQENATCAFEEDFQGLTTRNLDNVLPSLEQLADLQTRRARRAAMLEERVAGGQLDPNVTRQIAVAMDAQEKVARLKGAFAIQAKSPVTVIAQVNSQGHEGGGLLARLMSGIAAPRTGEGTIGLNPPREGDDAKVIEISTEDISVKELSLESQDEPTPHQ